MDYKDEIIASQQSEIAMLRQQIEMLKSQVSELMEKLKNRSISKNSSNSHNPPSQDKASPKRNQSLRAASNLNSGGQLGHQGSTLEFHSNPDHVEDLKSFFCTNCGLSLVDCQQELVSRRQVVNLPLVVPKYTEYRQFEAQCDCGHVQKSSYPKGVRAPIQYGTSVESAVSYLSVFQYLPYQRLQTLLKDFFNLPISQGTIKNILQRATAKTTPIYELIHQQIKESSYVGSDETGAKVAGEKYWIWVWQNQENTYIKAFDNRSFGCISEVFPDGLADAIVGSDRLAAQLKTFSKGKQLCFPHLLRELNYLIQMEKLTWTSKFKALLKEALALNKEAPQFTKEDPKAVNLEERLDQLMAVNLDKTKTPLTNTFQKSMLKNRAYILTFLYHIEVPPDNNASERAVRNVKVKQKISGQFKSGQQEFCVLRSVIDTLKKRGLNVIEHIQQIMDVYTLAT